MEIGKLICEACKRTVDKLYKHHVIPKKYLDGKLQEKTVNCCQTCSKQIHMLFSERELAKITFEELLKTKSMEKYVNWIKKRKGSYKMKMSNRIKNNIM